MAVAGFRVACRCCVARGAASSVGAASAAADRCGAGPQTRQRRRPERLLLAHRPQAAAEPGFEHDAAGGLLSCAPRPRFEPPAAAAAASTATTSATTSATKSTSATTSATKTTSATTSATKTTSATTSTSATTGATATATETSAAGYCDPASDKASAACALGHRAERDGASGHTAHAHNGESAGDSLAARLARTFAGLVFLENGAARVGFGLVHCYIGRGQLRAPRELRQLVALVLEFALAAALK